MSSFLPRLGPVSPLREMSNQICSSQPTLSYFINTHILYTSTHIYYQHTSTTYIINTHQQHIISIHINNIYYQHTSTTYIINTYIINTYIINTYIINTYIINIYINIYYQHTYIINTHISTHIYYQHTYINTHILSTHIYYTCAVHRKNYNIIVFCCLYLSVIFLSTVADSKLTKCFC